MKDKTIIHIFYPGDRSVGISNGNAKIEFDCNLLEMVEREETRKDFKKFFSQYEHCGDCEVRFGDECSDCLAVKTENGDCPNKNCLRNMPD
jgi:hypothetical protein